MMIMDDDDDDEWLCWFGCCWFCLNTTQKNFPVDDTQHQDHLKFLTKSHSKKVSMLIVMILIVGFNLFFRGMMVMMKCSF